MGRSFPEISQRGLVDLDVALPALAGIRIALTGGRGTSKFHVPVSDLRLYHPGACRYSKPAGEAATFSLLDVFDRICKKCSIILPAGPDALWRAAAFVAGRRQALSRALADREPRTWLGYARHAADHDPGDDGEVGSLLSKARSDAALVGDADALAGAWRRLMDDRRTFLDAYAADCPEIESYNGARDAVRRSAGSPERQALDQISEAVGKATRTREHMYSPPPRLDAGALVCGVWLAARSRGRSAGRAADLAASAAGAELAGARVVDVTRLPTPPRTPGSEYESPSAWADAELAAWWPAAVAALCARLEENFEAESADASTRLLLVRDWPLTCVRDAPVAYLAASPVLGPIVPHGYREYGQGASWSDGDRPGPSFSAVIAAPAHLVAKLEREQAALPAHHQKRFTAGGPAPAGAAGPKAAAELLRSAFPLLPGDGEGEPPVPCPAVAEQRHARQAEQGMPLASDEDLFYRLADSVGNGYRSWVPDAADDMKSVERLATWLRWTVLRVDMLCGPSGAAGQWASLFGTLDSVTAAGLGFSPGGRHRPVHIPWHRIVALSGAPRWDRGHYAPELWQPYEPVTAPPQPPSGPGPVKTIGSRLRAVPTPDGAA